MKTLEINEKRRKNLGVKLTKVLISMLIIALELQSLSQSYARTQYSYHMGIYENKFIRIFMNFDEINEKLQKNQGIILTKLLISQLIVTLE